MNIENGKNSLNNGELEAALEVFQLAVEAQPTDHEATYFLGLTQLKLDRPSLALMHFNRSLELCPDNPVYLSDRAVAKLRLEDQRGAMTDLNHCVELDPHYSFRYSMRAFVRDAIGDVHGAVEDYRKAVELDPEDAIAHNNLGLSEEKLGYTSEAESNFRMADTLAGIEHGETVSEHTLEWKKDAPQEEPTPHTTAAPTGSPSAKDYIRTVSRVFTDAEQRKEFFRFTMDLFRKDAK